ncbi:preprotein translocase subunit SecG [Natronospirillum operosum]|uniref:Protein-export membrane protein SecG n=1 Tax=Natronospirillum operosum TaxID=2759953 RepID=A0A4Z0WDE7_9GAMM|nr:preprotein translocase subunit SecG [Natronospirillum operosum]TGG94123.1 preprotein translocase subunit SecG [Natronospirillum operosum]
MEAIILAIHVVLIIAMVVFILLQRGKGAEAGAAFGGGGGASQGLFGASGGANFLSRTTAFLATAFFGTSLVLAVIASNRAEDDGQIQIDESILLEETAPVEQETGDPAFPDVE